KLIAKIIADDQGLSEGLTINFYNQANENEVLIGNAKTDVNGIAELEIPSNFVSICDEEFFMNYIARFEGNEKVDAAEEVLAVKDANIDFEFVEIDSVKQIKFKGTYSGNNGEVIPIADEDLFFFVPRMFSHLKIAEGWLETDGTGMVEFPEGISGDSLGIVPVIAKMEEHFEYGNVEKIIPTNWAIPFHPSHIEGPYRELWTPIAPLWMIITLIIMLSGVWGHYIYAIVSLLKIKKLARKNQTE
ncbi:hypothetical protein N9164_15490, partial [Draconibacterium sp.]|nr:hypothetical protein [Draconibacterium sp.]